MRSLRLKMVLVMILMVACLMLVMVTFLTSRVVSFYMTEFYEQMERSFTTGFLQQLQSVATQSQDEAAGAEQLKELVMAQSDLGIDITDRNVYILAQDGRVLTGSNGETMLSTTPNLLTAMSGAIGQQSAMMDRYMDLAVPITGGERSYIVYVLDNRGTVNNLTDEIVQIILRALVLGLAFCIALSIILSQIIIAPIERLTRGTQRVASGDFSEKLEVSSRDEIGTLTQSFNHMAQVLQDTIAEVENERGKLSTLFLHMTDGVVAFDTSGQLIHCNPAALSMLRRNESELRYDSIFGSISPLQDLLKLQRPQFAEGSMQVGELELELSLAPFSSASAGGVIAVIHDVTEQRRAEQNRKEFVANVSHELRTPLTNIKSYAETIVQTGDELPAELRDNFMGVILSETDRMTRIVQDLLTLSRFDSGRMEMNFTRFDFRQSVESVCKAEELDAQRHSHTLTLHNGPSATIHGDRSRIEQVIMNILSNAIKYTPDGGQIDVRTGLERGKIWVQVQDTGIGIPEKDLPRLFERFYRVDKARSRESGGTGLGLSIAQEILRLHNGEIRIDSIYGQGTTVTILLQIASEEESV